MDILKAATLKPRKLGKAGAQDAVRAGRDNLVHDLQEIESRAHHLGMHVTAHALNRAKNAAGWEIAGNIEQAGKAALKSE